MGIQSGHDLVKSSQVSMTRQTSARKKIMDLLSRRSHSEKEIFAKLTGRFPEDEIRAGIEEAKRRGWMLAPQELAEQTAQNLHRKNKGFLYIQGYLEEKGLPQIICDEELEIAKALAILEKLKSDENKARRLLISRGFTPDTVRKVLHEEC